MHPVLEAIPVGRALVKAKHGLFLVLTNDLYIGKCLLGFGQYSEGELNLLYQLASPNSAAIEVGSNIGALSIPMAKYLAGINSQIYCYEPQHEIFQLLNANFALNAIANAFASPVALGGQLGNAKALVIPDYGKFENYGGVAFGLVDQLCTDQGLVLMSTIDEEFKSVNQPISLIKIDVEGSELQVLYGAQEVIRKHRPNLYFENDRLEFSERLLSFVGDLGYVLYWDFPLLVDRQNYFQSEVEPVLDGIISINILALPREKNIPVANLKIVDDISWHPLRGQIS